MVSILEKAATGLWKMGNSLKNLGLTQEHSRELKARTVVTSIWMEVESTFLILVNGLGGANSCYLYGI